MDPITIADKDFQELVAKRARTLLGLVSYISQCRSSDKILIRPLLGQLLSQSMQIEELLDAYDARNNCRWCAFGSLTAAIKLFSDAGYELLHIQHTLPSYRLIAIEQDFVKATRQALEFVGELLLRAARQMLDKTAELGLPVTTEKFSEEIYTEQLPAGRLPHDCRTRRIETVSEIVTMLATAFLSLAAESDRVHAVVQAKPEEYASYASDSISEESLRALELRFHNLQSLYDTYVSGTEAENFDTDLPVLRGHISVVFHLLKTATLFGHYYERHVNCPTCDLKERQAPLVTADELLAVLMNYSVSYISRYITCAEQLCREMLKRYIEADCIEVLVPPYRGFHVRPSTLISKLVLHYGSDVQMELEGESYDAGSPLELFRANEKVNARKRHWLAAEIDRLKLVLDDIGGKDITDIIRDIILTLAGRGKIVLYEQPLKLSAELSQKQGALLEQVTDEIARLLAIGKIDISVELRVKFTGDRRVLADIKLLAESGYGEDSFGNNIALPEKLAYLRH
ncbi:MAG: HPr family phosphocarrier protein [Planctomycetota bacterium]|jgi:hypothetical protein